MSLALNSETAMACRIAGRRLMRSSPAMLSPTMFAGRASKTT